MQPDRDVIVDSFLSAVQSQAPWIQVCTNLWGKKQSYPERLIASQIFENWNKYSMQYGTWSLWDSMGNFLR